MFRFALGVVVIPVMMGTAAASDRPATGRGEREPPVDLAGDCRGIGIAFPPLARPHRLIRTIKASLGTARARGSDLIALFLLRGRQLRFLSRRLLTQGGRGWYSFLRHGDQTNLFFTANGQPMCTVRGWGMASLTRRGPLTRMYNLERGKAISWSAQIMHSGGVLAISKTGGCKLGE